MSRSQFLKLQQWTHCLSFQQTFFLVLCVSRKTPFRSMKSNLNLSILAYSVNLFIHIDPLAKKVLYSISFLHFNSPISFKFSECTPKSHNWKKIKLITQIYYLNSNQFKKWSGVKVNKLAFKQNLPKRNERIRKNR